MKKKISAIVLALVILFSISFSTPVSEVINPDGQIKVIAAATNSKIPHLTGVANTAKGVKVSWNKVKGATKYKVYRRVANGSWSCIATVTSNTYTDTKAVSGTTYRYTVRALVSGSYGKYESGLAIKRLANPSGIKATNVAAGIKVTWSAVKGATGYKVYRKAGNATSWTYLGAVKSNSYGDKKVSSGTNYTYTIKAYNGSTLSSYNATGTTTKRISNPASFKAAQNNQLVKVTWGAVKGATGYRVYRKVNNATSWTYLGAVKTNAYVDKNVYVNQTYRYTVKAYYSNIVSSYSSTGVAIKFTANGAYKANLKNIPAFDGSTPYVVINNNVPGLSAYDRSSKYFEKYSALDSLGRCGVAFACLGIETMPTEDRGSIGSVKPSGWHTVKYDCVDGKYLYNRCHLIGFQLSAENANEKNLITGTRYLNVDGMLPFENMVADYIEETGNHVLYRVTPVFKGNELVARGVQIEAYSVEDKGEGISFNVYCYNNQPGITINYATGDSALSGQTPGGSSGGSSGGTVTGTTYILNTGTNKFHYPDCGSADKISESNRAEYTGSREDLIAQGYSPCGNCDP